MASEDRLISVDAAIRKLEQELEIIPTVSLVNDPFKRPVDAPLDSWIRRLVSKRILDVIGYLKRQPTVDAVEVVHGRREYVAKTKDAKSGYACSVCLGPVWHAPDVPLAFCFCPNCGAKMDGGGNESA